MKTRTLRYVCYTGAHDKPKEWVVNAELTMKVNADNWDEWREAVEREIYSVSRTLAAEGQEHGLARFISGKRHHCHCSNFIRCCNACGLPYDAPSEHSKYCVDCGPTAPSRNQTAKRKAERQAALKPRLCEHCGESFTPKRRDARFCSAKCRVYANRLAGTREGSPIGLAVNLAQSRADQGKLDESQKLCSRSH